METLALDDTFHVYAVVNGITTATVTTTNPDATITSIVDTSQMERGYFTLEVSGRGTDAMLRASRPGMAGLSPPYGL